MTTNSDVVRRALRAIGELAAGKSPTGNDAADGLERLQSLLLDLIGLLKVGRWCEVAVSDDYTAREGDRCTVTSPGTVTLPTVITDRGRARPPLDLARVQILGADAENAGLWVYSATKGAWAQVDALTINADFPLGEEDVEGVAAQLAVNIAGEYGAEKELPARTIALAQISGRSFRSRFYKTQPTDWSRPDACGPLTVPGWQSPDYY